MKLVSFEAIADPQSENHLGVICGEGAYIVDIQAVEILRRRRMVPGLMSMMSLLHDFDFGLSIIQDDLAFWEKEQPPGCAYTWEEIKLLSPLTLPKSLRHIMEDPHMYAPDGVVSIGKYVSRFLTRLLSRKKEVGFSYYLGNHKAVIGNQQEIPWPASFGQLDLEVELAIFIKKEGVNIPEEQALEYVGGLSLFNDITATDLYQQELEGKKPHTKSKSFNHSNVMGPHLLTLEALAEQDEFHLEVAVNDKEWISESYPELPVSISKIISDISQHETLSYGDVITTGMLPNACGRVGDKYLKAGDTLKIQMEPFGTLTNKIVRFP
ncbi:MAG: fumarylacetoacetate hydrolase family protein [Bacteroidota bacterium]